MNKAILLLSLLLSSVIPASGAPAQAPAFGPDLYTAQPLAGGYVALFQNEKPLGTLCAQIFEYDKTWKYDRFEGLAGDPRFQAVATLPQGGKVGLSVTAEISGSTLKVKYLMVPLADVQVVSARVALFTPYDMWKGSNYQWGSNQGQVPGEKKADFVFTSTQEGVGKLGPQLDKGLTLDWVAKGLKGTLTDNRQWTPDLTLIWDHSEPGDKNWLWKKGEEKSFEVTLQLNRDFSDPPRDAGKPSDGFAGVWCGMAENGIISDYRIAVQVRKEGKGKWGASYDQTDGGIFNNRAKAWVDPKTKRLHIGFEEGNDMDLSLDPSGMALTGEAVAQGKTYQLHFKRSLDYFGPRLAGDGSPVTDYSYQAPPTLPDGWKVGTLSTSPLDQGILEQGVARILKKEYPNIQGLVIAQGDKLLMEEYFYGFGPEVEHQLQSTTKSVLSLLFGIAQDKGLVRVSDKLFDYFPEFRNKPEWRTAKDKITLAHMLTMSSGFDCDDWASGDACNRHMWTTQDWLNYDLSMDIENPPGKKFAYSTSLMEPIGAIIAMKSGMSIPDFAQAYLYDPLGIQARHWTPGPNNITEVGGSHKLRPRDMAKLGLLYLQHGKWDGKQVISEKYLEEATKRQAPLYSWTPKAPPNLNMDTFGGSIDSRFEGRN